MQHSRIHFVYVEPGGEVMLRNKELHVLDDLQKSDPVPYILEILHEQGHTGPAEIINGRTGGTVWEGLVK